MKMSNEIVDQVGICAEVVQQHAGQRAHHSKSKVVKDSRVLIRRGSVKALY